MHGCKARTVRTLSVPESVIALLVCTDKQIAKYTDICMYREIHEHIPSLRPSFYQLNVVSVDMFVQNTYCISTEGPPVYVY